MWWAAVGKLSLGIMRKMPPDTTGRGNVWKKVTPMGCNKAVIGMHSIGSLAQASGKSRRVVSPPTI
jgi:hypothetical protein